MSDSPNNGPGMASMMRTALCGAVLLATPALPASGQVAAAPTQSATVSSDDALVPRRCPAECSDALASIRQHDWARAEASLRSAIVSHPDAGEAHFLLGYTLYREDQASASLAEYTTGARLEKPDAKDLAVVAMDYVLLHDYADADRWLTQAVAWDGANPLYWYYLGRTKYVENYFQGAIDAFGRCLALRPQDVRAEYNLGLAYQGLGQNGRAALAFRTAIARQKDLAHSDAQPYLDLGILQLSQGNAAGAADNLQTAASLDKRNPRIHEELGQAYEQTDRLPRAQAELEKAVELAPQVPSLHFVLGRIYRKEGLQEKAREQFSLCAALNARHSSDSAETPNADARR
jgi:Flp pilus assembly protein TadD